MLHKYVCQCCTSGRRAALKRPRNGALVCQDCFFASFEEEVHDVIVRTRLFQRGDVVACGASGGKDSTVLLHLLHELNQRHDYGITLVLVSVDEGIAGYRDDSIATVQQNAKQYGLPLHIVSFRELFGWTMDDIVRATGLSNSCTYCGVFRRQALERGARMIGANKIATGHNADDMAETLLMNMLRADAPRLARSAGILATPTPGEQVVARVKPLSEAYEKEIVLYAHFKKLLYFTTECTYSAEAFRGVTRNLIKELEVIRPRCIADMVRSANYMDVAVGAATPSGHPTACQHCGHVTSQRLCRACVLLASLDTAVSVPVRSVIDKDVVALAAFAGQHK